MPAATRPPAKTYRPADAPPRVWLGTLLAAALLLMADGLAATPPAPARLAAASAAGAEPDTLTKAHFWTRRAARNETDPLAHLQAGNALAQLARETGDHAFNRDAERYLRAALTLGSDSYSALTGLAFVLGAQHRFTEARQAATRARDINPHAIAAWAALGDAALEQGDLPVAEQAYARLVSQDRGVFTLVRLANLAFAQGREAQALAALDEAVETGISRRVNAAEVARCLVLAGNAYFQGGRFEQAETRYQRALGMRPDDYLAIEHLAELRAAEGRLEASRALYAQIANLAAHPDLAAAWSGVERQLGDETRADTLLEQAVSGYRTAVDSGDPGYLRHLALHLADGDGGRDEAVRLAERDVQSRPTAESWAVLAWTLHRAGRSDAALNALARVSERNGVLSADSLYRSALVYRDAGDTARARRLLEQGLARRGRHPAGQEIGAALSSLPTG